MERVFALCGYPSGDVSAMEPDAELQVQLKQKALDYLSTRPNVGDAPNSMRSWGEFFRRSYLAMELTKQRKGGLNQNWFETHEPKFSVHKDGTYIVSWEGAPGYEQDPTQPGGPDYGPNWFDEKGNRTYLIWCIDVMLTKDLQPLKVEVSEVGGIR